MKLIKSSVTILSINKVEWDILQQFFEVFETLKQLEEFSWKLFSMIKYDNPFF